MNSSVKAVIAIMAITHSASALAQTQTGAAKKATATTKVTTPVLAIPPMAYGSFPVAIGAGTYNYQSLDKTRIIDALIAQNEKVRGEDMTALAEMVQQLNLSFTGMLQVVYGATDATGKKTLIGLTEHSVKSGYNPTKKDGKLTLTDFMQLKFELDRRAAMVRNNIATIDAIPSMLTTANTDVGMKDADVAKLRKNFEGVSLAPLKAHYNKQLDALLAETEKLKFGIKLAEEKLPVYFQTGFANTTELLSKRAYSKEDFAKMKDDATNAAADALLPIREIHKTLNLSILKQMQTEIDVFGKKGSYRIELNTSGFENSIKLIEEMFYVRSTLRMIYGMNLGGFRVVYQKKALHWDKLNNSSIVFDNGFATDPSELTRQQDAMFLALNTMNDFNGIDDKGKVDPSKKTGYDFSKLLSKDVNTFSKVMSIWTFLKGKTREVSINHVLLTLMLADTQEELMLVSSAGHEGIRESYNRRYRNGADWTKARDFYFPKPGTLKTPEQKNVDPKTLVGANNIAKAALDKSMDAYSISAEIEAALELLEAANPYFQIKAGRYDEI
ncbi:MAG: hypothetical protein JNL01_00605 [Bdellovibrionales bacterium]|nr:hypothetical protein [Bdellovibrionales bacterium]